MDLSIARNIRIGGGKLQPRVDMFNAFNTVVLGAAANASNDNRVTQLQLNSPTDPTIRNNQLLADGTLNPARVSHGMLVSVRQGARSICGACSCSCGSVLIACTTIQRAMRVFTFALPLGTASLLTAAPSAQRVPPGSAAREDGARQRGRSKSGARYRSCGDRVRPERGWRHQGDHQGRPPLRCTSRSLSTTVAQEFFACPWRIS